MSADVSIVETLFKLELTREKPQKGNKRNRATVSPYKRKKGSQFDRSMWRWIMDPGETLKRFA